MNDKIQEFKVWPFYFRSLLSREKMYEFRTDPKGVRVGDFIRLREFDKTCGYTGREMLRLVTSFLDLESVGGKGFIFGFSDNSINMERNLQDRMRLNQ